MDTIYDNVCVPMDYKLPEWMDGCPLVSDWVRYNGHIYYADLNFEKSNAAKEPVFDLAYCKTRAMNGIYLIQRPWDKRKFTRWRGHSTWGGDKKIR